MCVGVWAEWLNTRRCPGTDVVSCPLGCVFALHRDCFLFHDPVVTFFFQLQRQLLISGADDPPIHQHVHKIRHDVIQQPLIMRDHQLRVVVPLAVCSRHANTIFNASMSSPESVSSRTAKRGSRTAI